MRELKKSHVPHQVSFCSKIPPGSLYSIKRPPVCMSYMTKGISFLFRKYSMLALSAISSLVTVWCPVFVSADMMNIFLLPEFISNTNILSYVLIKTLAFFKFQKYELFLHWLTVSFLLEMLYLQHIYKYIQ